VSVGVAVSKGLQHNRNNLKTLAREMRLETCGMQTVQHHNAEIENKARTKYPEQY